MSRDPQREALDALVFPIGEGPWNRMQARIEAMPPGSDRVQALVDLNAMLIEHRAALEAEPVGLDEIRSRIVAMRPWPEGETLLQALERYAATIAALDTEPEPNWRKAIAESDEWIGWDTIYCYWCGQVEHEGHVDTCTWVAAQPAKGEAQEGTDAKGG